MRVTKEEFTALLSKKKKLKDEIEMINISTEKKIAVIVGRLVEVEDLISRVKVEEDR